MNRYRFVISTNCGDLTVTAEGATEADALGRCWASLLLSNAGVALIYRSHSAEKIS